jgi:multiple sugar transport system permease protein
VIRRRRTLDVVCYVFLVAAGIVTLLPFVWMVSSSLMPRHEIFAPGFRLFPSNPTFANYGEALREAPLLRFLTNGVIVTVSILVAQLATILPAGYAFARLRFPGQVLLFALVLAALGVPGYVRAIPNFLLLSRLDLLNTYAALIVPFVGSAFGIFLMRQFFRQLPSDVLDAARLDGCGTGQLIWYVLVPLTRPAVAAFAVFSVVAHWNDFFWPLVVIRTSSLLTPPAGIAFFANAEGGENWGVVMAAGVVVIAPLVAVFLVARRHFIASLAQGATKG